MNLISLQQTRTDLTRRFKGIGAEIGVEQGAFSEIICQVPGVTQLYSIDAWKAYRGYRDHTRQSKLDRLYAIATQRLAPYNCVIIRKFSLDAARDFVDGSLDFVYIDANHDYQHVSEDLAAWTQKIKPGGIVGGHDYIRRKGQKQFYAVIPAVNNFVKANKIQELIIYRGDSSPSFLFLKP